ncbi:DNA polymerase III subunit alpha [Mycoplasmatota bacterium]|nr:DNA polymerase III subunit alpha [Mycoplasmatota bacterium]
MTTNLYLTTCYSLLNSTVRIDEVIVKAKELGYESLAITDNNLYGAFKFYLKCKEVGIKPIIGLKARISDTPFLLYAKNNIGYLNLCKISSFIELKGGIDLSKFTDFSEGIIIVSLGDYILEDISKYKNFDFYLGIQVDDLDLEVNYAPKILELGRVNNVDCITLSPVKYIDKSDYLYYKALRCIDLSTKYEFEDVSLGVNYLKGMNEEKLLFSEYEAAYKKSELLADKCNVEIEYGAYQLPKYPLNGYTSKDYLFALCKKGLEKRLKRLDVDINVYKQRLLDELKMINQMGFNDYFLIVWDLVTYAKKNKIFVGPGRGSAAGSLVSYVLGITNTDPIKYDLLFERFLNPERLSMPDIDLDFPDNKRDEMIQYVKNKYSVNNVSLIVTFGTFAGRSAIRDVAKILDINSNTLDEVLKHIPINASNLKKLMEEEDLCRLRKGFDEIEMLLDYASKIEGLPRHTSTHAAGVIISGKNILEYSPIQKGMFDLNQTQFEAKDLEKLGLLKMDFLGLRNLTILDKTVDLIKRYLNKDINLYELDFDDKLVFDLIGRADTFGVFQLESAGMRSLLTKLNVTEFEDVIAAIALHRPGPMENIPEYVARKTGRKRINYIHKDLEPFLKSTYGIIVYQEQIIKIANEFAGYTLAEADLLRRAVSKKEFKTLNDERVRFVRKCKEMGHLESDANHIYDYIVKFANYGFNRSHSVAYAMIAYQCAWLKVHYPLYYMTVLLSSVTGSDSLTTRYLRECKEKDLEILPPSINKSGVKYLIENGKIRVPLIGVRNLGFNTIKKIVDERNNKEFTDYLDFINRTRSFLNEKLIENLIYSSALDEFNLSKKQMVSKINDATKYSEYGTLIADLSFDYGSDDEYSLNELIDYEKNTLGYNLKYHFIYKYLGLIKEKNLDRISDASVSKEIKFIAKINRISVIRTKNNNKMAFLTLEDETGIVDSVIFPSVYEKYDKIIMKDQCLLFRGVQETHNGKTNLNIDKIGEIEV